MLLPCSNLKGFKQVLTNIPGQFAIADRYTSVDTIVYKPLRKFIRNKFRCRNLFVTKVERTRKLQFTLNEKHLHCLIK